MYKQYTQNRDGSERRAFFKTNLNRDIMKIEIEFDNTYDSKTSFSFFVLPTIAIGREVWADRKEFIIVLGFLFWTIEFNFITTL